jgi:hypothetical protein
MRFGKRWVNDREIENRNGDVLYIYKCYCQVREEV